MGVNGGWGGGSSGGNFGSPTGGLVGGTVGYNYQIGQFVAGLEGDWDWADLNKNGTVFGNAYSNKIDSVLTARARAGVALDRALLYVTGGYAGAEDKVNVPTVLGSTDWRSGGAIGGGIEYAFTNNISAKAEYIYTAFPSKIVRARLQERLGYFARPRRSELQVLIGPTAQTTKARRGNPPAFFVHASVVSRKMPSPHRPGRRRRKREPADQPRMTRPPFAGEAQVEIAERAGERDCANMGRAGLGRLRFERRERPRHLPRLIVDPLGRTFPRLPHPPLVDLQHRGVGDPVGERLQGQALGYAPPNPPGSAARPRPGRRDIRR